MEFNINADPMAYEARPVFGAWTKRQATVGAAVIVLVGAIGLAFWLLDANANLTGVVCCAIGFPVGYFLLSRRHGLLPEQWVPIVRAEREAPRERVWRAPRPTCAADALRRQDRLSRRELRRTRKAREAELEEDDIIERYIENGTDDVGDTDGVAGTGEEGDPAAA